MTEPAQPLSGTRVLVVEDEALIAEEIRDRLSSRGMKVVGIADNAADAVALASGERPDLALMDIRLKGKADGVDAAVRIYRDFGVPAVFLTAHSDEATLKRALLAGQFGYVLKPFRELDLLVAIRMALARHRIDLTLRESQSTFRSEVRRLNSDLEAHIAERTAALRRANSELEAFIYSVSHDLRAPLRTVGGMSRMLREAIASQPAPRASELLDGIDESMRHMATRIEALLEFSRLGSQPLHRALTDVQALANEVIAEAGAEIVRHEVVVGELPAVFADPMLLRIVLGNLLSNAIKFSSARRHPRIEIGCERVDGEEVFYVRDNGVGMPMRYAEKAFEVFERLHTDTRFPGVGAGLAIVKRIIERHGGRIAIEAKVGKGATFRFTLPSPEALRRH